MHLVHDHHGLPLVAALVLLLHLLLPGVGALPAHVPKFATAKALHLSCTCPADLYRASSIMVFHCARWFPAPNPPNPPP